MNEQTPEELVSRAETAGLNKIQLCEKAGVHRGTLDRWLAGTMGPSLKSWNALWSVVEEAEALAAGDAVATSASPHRAAG